jgi:hypothetical protein
MPFDPAGPVIPALVQSPKADNDTRHFCPVCGECLPTLAAYEPAVCEFCPWGVSLVRSPFVQSPFRRGNL